METLHFSIDINAPREKVWNTMLDKETYPEWTSVFMPGSYYKGEWKKGSKMLFLGPGETGEGGMVAEIAEVRPNEFLSIEHRGIVENGVEDTESEKVKQWAGAHENYTFNEKDGGTELLIDVDTADEFKEMFSEMWPKALEKLKGLCEK